MAITFEEASQLRSNRLFFGLRIEGLGSAKGQDIFVSRVPDYAAGDETYKAWLVAGSLPSQLPEEIPAQGGCSSAGSLTFELVDGVGRQGDELYDYLTARFGTDSQADLQLDGDISATATGLDLLGAADKIAEVAIDSLLYIGGEALIVTGVTPVSAIRVSVSVDRAALDTEAAAHAGPVGGTPGASVFFAMPYVKGRRVRLYLGYDEPGATAAIETEVGPGWFIEADPGLSQGLQAYRFSAISTQGLLDRQIKRRQWRGRILRIDGADDRQLLLSAVEGNMPDLDATHFDGTVFLQHGKEISLVEWSVSQRPTWLVRHDRRGIAGTPVEAFEVGGEVSLVLCADTRDGLGSFRVQEPGAETSSRSTGTWVAKDHPIAAALAVITSSKGGDGLACTNWVSSYGNYSALPEGFGAGIAAARIAWSSFLEVWYRHPEWRLPNLVLTKGEPLRAWLDREILRPFGLVLTVDDGLLTLLEGELAGAAAAGDYWTKEDVLLRQDGDAWIWQLEQERADDLQAARVTFVARNTDGVESAITFDDADFPGLFGQDAQGTQVELPGVEIPVPGARFDGSGSDDFFEKIAFSWLLNFRLPPYRIRVSTDLSKVSTSIFRRVLFSHPELALDVRRARGWTNVPCRVLKKTIDFGAAKLDFELLSYLRAGNVGLLSPAAVVLGVAGNVARCHANRFTDANVPAGLELAARDVDAFTKYDVVRLRNLDGTAVAGTQVVVDIISADDKIELDGDFGGALAPDKVLVFAAYDDQLASQKAVYVSLAEGATELLGTDGDPPFTFGES